MHRDYRLMSDPGVAMASRRALPLLVFSAGTLVACYAARAAAHLLATVGTDTGTPTGWDWGAWAGIPAAGFAPWAGIGVVAVAWGARVDRTTAGAAAVGVALAAGAAHLVAGDTARVVAFGLVAATAEALVGGLLVQRLMRRWGDPASFVGVVTAAAVAAVAVGVLLALPGLTSVSTRSVGALTIGWSLSHLAAIVVVAGALLAPARQAPSFDAAAVDSRWPMGGTRELALQAAALAVLAWAAFIPSVDLPLAFLPAIALVWGAWRLSPRVTGAELVALAALATVATAHGRGPFGASSDQLAGAAAVHSYLVSVALLCMLLATYAEQLRRDVDVIEQAGNLSTSLFDGSVVGMLVVPLEGADAGRVVQANPSALKLLGDGIVGTPWLAMLHPGDRSTAEVMMSGLRGDARPWRGEMRHLRPTGAVVDTMVAAAPTHTRKLGWVAGLQLLDVHGQRQAERELRRLVLHDPLTGLPNRVLLTEHVTRALAARARSGGEVALLYFDCDGFKQINESAGHIAGDRVLTEVAGRLLHSVRPSDSVARLGGDEFAVLCTDLDAAAEAEMVAERLLATFTRPFELDAMSLHLTVSIGVSVAGPGTTAEGLLREADTAMYAAKRDGRARFATYEEGLQVEATRRLTVGSDLRRALRDGELRVHYQPIVSIPGGRVVAAEALVRWQHPELGLLAPESFLDVAEETDLVCDIDAWVAAQATRDAVEWPQQQGSDIDLHLNFSARHLGNHDAPELVGSCLRQSGLVATRLVVEFTETSLLSVADGGRADVDQLRETGVRFAADDFGTGYATLAQLVNLPLDMVKVDREFVARLETDPRARAVVEAVATLGRSLQLAVVAEGVERAEQQVLLEQYGVPAYQGFLHAPAVDVDTLKGMLALTA